MGNAAILALRVVISLALLGSVLVQAVMMPLVWADLEGTDDGLRATFIVILISQVVTLQICAICVWRLATMVRRGSVFSTAAFRYVDTIIGAVLLAAVLTGSIAFLLAPGSTPPGVVGLVCGAALVIGGVALIVVVLRQVLAQAVASADEVQHLQSELNEVV